METNEGAVFDGTFSLVPSASKETLARRIARRVEQEIIAAGWPIGSVLGSEQKLQDRWGVGRAVVREAVRLLESDGVASRRSGPGGGLVVAEPRTDTILTASSLFLDYRSVQKEDLWEAMEALHMASIGRLARSITTAGRAELREFLERHAHLATIDRAVGPEEIPDVPLKIATMCGNPALELFLAVTSAFSMEHGQPRIGLEAARWFYRQFSEIVDAVCSGDAALAQYLLRGHLRRVGASRSLRTDDLGNVGVDHAI